MIRGGSILAGGKDTEPDRDSAAKNAGILFSLSPIQCFNR